MQIKEVAKKLNISARTIRFYEEKGLISPTKQEQNLYRTFSERDIWRLQTIISLREAGMTLADIQKALREIEQNDKEELLYYLELQRSVIFSQWVELKHMIKTTDRMIQLLHDHQSLPLDEIYKLAEGSKNLRLTRKNWRDRWNFDQLASTHDELVLTDQEIYKDYYLALNQIVKWVCPVEKEIGLDIGIGTGNLASLFVALGISMSGVDQSSNMLKLCKQKHPGIETRTGNFLAIPYLDGEFNFVVSSFAFRHLIGNEIELALEEIRRVLKPHGRICIADLFEDHLLSNLLSWFEKNSYLVKFEQLNKNKLHIILAVPIR